MMGHDRRYAVDRNGLLYRIIMDAVSRAVRHALQAAVIGFLVALPLSWILEQIAPRTPSLLVFLLLPIFCAVFGLGDALIWLEEGNYRVPLSRFDPDGSFPVVAWQLLGVKIGDAHDEPTVPLKRPPQARTSREETLTKIKNWLAS